MRTTSRLFRTVLVAAGLMADVCHRRPGDAPQVARS
jgi:hypothetical protein